MMAVDEFALTDRADSRFGRTDISPKRTVSVTNAQPMICFPQADPNSNEYFDVEDIGSHPRPRQEHLLMSRAIISQVEMKVFRWLREEPKSPAPRVLLYRGSSLNPNPV